jgi:hypothetical protein
MDRKKLAETLTCIAVLWTNLPHAAAVKELLANAATLCAMFMLPKCSMEIPTSIVWRSCLSLQFRSHQQRCLLSVFDSAVNSVLTRIDDMFVRNSLQQMTRKEEQQTKHYPLTEDSGNPHIWVDFRFGRKKTRHSRNSRTVELPWNCQCVNLCLFFGFFLKK